MVTLNFHGLINGKNENWHLLLFHCKHFDYSFLEMFDEWSSTKHILFCPNLSIRLVVMAIHVILAWNEIGRSAVFGREIGVPDKEVFSRRKKQQQKTNNFSGKIVISSTVVTVKCFICH